MGTGEKRGNGGSRVLFLVNWNWHMNGYVFNDLPELLAAQPRSCLDIFSTRVHLILELIRGGGGGNGHSDSFHSFTSIILPFFPFFPSIS